MKLNTELSHDAEYIGDVKENRVGIDKSNLDFITTLLTSNLYSKPLESFFRETIANAYDSHVEANTSEHILLLIQDTEKWKTYRISIRDYGTGVSPERFDKIYKNIGSSTKRESNDYIGMFGIGRFSCLSCADVAHITSFYKGKKYSYVMYKNGGGINIDLLSAIEGDFKDGLEVSIEKYIYNDLDLTRAIKGVALFDKLYISYKGSNSYIRRQVDDFNSRKIANFNTFSMCSLLRDSNYFKVGNVIYECERGKLETTGGIIIDLPIGSVDITPNREALQFTDFTNNTVTRKIAEVKQELKSMVDSRINEDMTLTQFCEDFVFSNYYTFEEDGEKLFISRREFQIDYSGVTIDGEQIPDKFIEFLETVRYLGIKKNLIHKVVNRSVYGRIYDKDLRALLLGRFIIVDKQDKVTKHDTLSYFLENATKNSVILVYEGIDFLKIQIENYANKYKPNCNVKECIDFMFKHLPIEKMSNDSVPSTYIESYKASQKGKKKSTNDKIPIRRYHATGYRMDYMNNVPSDGLVVYSTHTQEDYALKALSELAYYVPGMACVLTVKAEYIKLFEGNRRFISAENFMFMKNSILSKITTTMIIRRNFMETGLDYSETPIYREFYKKYNTWIRCFDYWGPHNTKTNLLSYYESKGWVNKSDIKYFSLTKEEIESYKSWKKLEMHKYDLVKAIAFKKYGHLPKIGLTPTVAPKLK